MTGQANTQVENPYVYWRSAQEYEQSGDTRSAEMGYKAAVIAADNLPLNEYRRNFQEELQKHQTIPGYKTPPNIDMAQLRFAYAELLTLPFAARVKLGHFLARQSVHDEAMEICNSAMALKIDEWVHEEQLYIDLKQQLENVMMAVQYASRRPTATGKQLLLRPKQQPTVQKKPVQPSKSGPAPMAMPDITEMWNAHMKASKQVARADVLSGQGETEKALSIDARTLVDSMFECLKRFIADLPSQQKMNMMISIMEPEFKDEQRKPGQYIDNNRTVRYYRFRASSALSTLSIRATEESVEVFAIATRDVLVLSQAEMDNCLRAKYICKRKDNQRIWTHENFPLYQDDMRVSLRNMFKELVRDSAEFFGHDSGSSMGGGHGLAKQLSELSQQRANLAEKIVYQQEMVQNRIARDIHDGVIADLLALKRSYEAHATNDQQVLRALEDVSQRLRNICSDLAPRDLQDWGLQTVVTDLITQVADRMQVRYQCNIAKDLPDLPQQVSLHLYRIIQECLNNLEKHSRASEFRVELSHSNGMLVASVQDNGVGFDPSAKDMRKAAQGGMGLDSIRERVELIRAYYPAQLRVQSQPGSGTQTTVHINTQA